MIRRLYKEFRIIKWPFIAAILSVPLTLLITEDCQLRWKIPTTVQLLCCALMGSAIFGQEFEYGMMEKLLTQPTSRVRIWREKLLVLVLCAGSGFLVNLINPEYCLPGLIRGFFFLNLDTVAYRNKERNIFLKAIIHIGPAYLAIMCAGSCAALYIRKTHTAFWGSLTSTLFIMILWQFMISLGFSLFGMSSILYSTRFQTYDNTIYITLPMFLWGMVIYILARKKFMKLEV
jgi:hypothetical protein